jgi:hypothetical protein
VSDIDIHVIDQAETWTDINGIEHRLADMEPRYCRNVAAFLMRRADEIAFRYGLMLARVPLPDMDTVAFDIVDADIGRETELFVDPAAWLADKPLLKALRERAGGAS